VEWNHQNPLINGKRQHPINAALEQLTSEGYAIQTEDIARLSPLVFEHINLLGRNAFSVPDSVVQGQLRSFAVRLMLWRISRDGDSMPKFTTPRQLNPVFRSIDPQHPIYIERGSSGI
jgi:Tn3 transposase DDE domain